MTEIAAAAPRVENQRNGSAWPAHLTGAGTILALILLLEVLTETGIINPFLVPQPRDVLLAFPMLVTHERLISRFFLSFAETFLSASLATIVGVAFGWLLHRSQLARRAYLGWVAALSATPFVLIYPLFLVVFGRSMATIVAMSFISCLAPIVLKTCEGLDAVHPAMLKVGRSFNLSPAQQFWLIKFPAAVPTIFGGIRLGLIYGLFAVLSLEYLIDFGGLGQLIADLADRYEIPAMYAAIIFVTLVSACFFVALNSVEKWLRPR